VKNELKAAQAALGELGKVDVAIATTRTELQDAETRLGNVVERWQVASCLDRPTACPPEVGQLEKRITELKARLSGLEKKRAEQEATLPAIAADSEEPVASFCDEQRQAYDRDLAVERERVAAVARRGQALRRLGVEVRIPLEHAHLEPAESDTRLASKTLEPLLVFNQVKARIGAATTRRAMAARFRPVFDADGRFEVVQPMAVAGASFRAGDTLTAHEVPAELLQRLYSARRVRMIGSSVHRFAGAEAAPAERIVVHEAAVHV